MKFFNKNIIAIFMFPIAVYSASFGDFLGNVKDFADSTVEIVSTVANDLNTNGHTKGIDPKDTTNNLPFYVPNVVAYDIADYNGKYKNESCPFKSRYPTEEEWELIKENKKFFEDANDVKSYAGKPLEIGTGGYYFHVYKGKINARESYAFKLFNVDDKWGKVGYILSKSKIVKVNPVRIKNSICILPKKEKISWGMSHKIPEPKLDSDGGGFFCFYKYKSLTSTSIIDYNFDYSYEYCLKKNMRLPTYDELEKKYNEKKIISGVYVYDNGVINFANIEDQRGMASATHVKCISK